MSIVITNKPTSVSNVSPSNPVRLDFRGTQETAQAAPPFWVTASSTVGAALRVLLLATFGAIALAFMLTALQPVLFVSLTLILFAVSPFLFIAMAFMVWMDRPETPERET